MSREKRAQADERDQGLIWEKVSEEHLVQDRWIDFRAVLWRQPDGQVLSPFYSYTKRSYVVVVALDEQGRFVCVRQFRPGVERVTCEFPAGAIERESAQADWADAETAARRELAEETGYVSEHWTRLLCTNHDATICSDRAFLLLAKDCRRVGEQHLDGEELLETVLLTREELQQRTESGEFAQAMHLLALLLAEREMSREEQEDREQV